MTHGCIHFRRAAGAKVHDRGLPKSETNGAAEIQTFQFYGVFTPFISLRLKIKVYGGRVFGLAATLEYE